MPFIQARDVYKARKYSERRDCHRISKSTEKILFECKFSLKKYGNYYKVNITTSRAHFQTYSLVVGGGVGGGGGWSLLFWNFWPPPRSTLTKLPPYVKILPVWMYSWNIWTDLVEKFSPKHNTVKVFTNFSKVERQMLKSILVAHKI